MPDWALTAEGIFATILFMGRVHIARTIEDLVTLVRGEIAGQVDAVVETYLVGNDSEQLWQRHAELAYEFLNAAPFSELSYRIWRRITGEDDNGGVTFQARSMEFLPPVEFPLTR